MNIFSLILRNLNFYFNKKRFKQTNHKGFLQNKKFDLQNLSIFKKVIIVVNDPSIIHLGDQLFFFSFANILKNNLSIEVMINKDDDIIFYDNFKKLKKKNKGFLYLSSIKFFTNHYQKFKNYSLLAIDLNQFDPKLRLTEYFKQVMYDKKSKVSLLKEFNNLKILKRNSINLKNKYLIINDEIFSSWSINFSKKRTALFDFARKVKNEKNISIIRIGKYKINNKIIDKDLSGIIRKQDIMPIIKHKNCLGVISFDNYFMHVASIFNKEIFVMPRGRNFRSNFIKILNISVPFFESKSKINILDESYRKYKDELINEYFYE